MVIPYLVFSGNCSDAITFYENAFDVKVSVKHKYEGYIPKELTREIENLNEWILHAEMQLADCKFWLADETEAIEGGNNVKIVITLPDLNKSKEVFSKLSEGGKITLPPTETFYSDFHAGLIDRFGVSWNIISEVSS